MDNKQLFRENLMTIFLNLYHKINEKFNIGLKWIDMKYNDHNIKIFYANYSHLYENYDSEEEHGVHLRIELLPGDQLTVYMKLKPVFIDINEFYFEKYFTIPDIEHFYSNSTLKTFSEFIDVNFDKIMLFMENLEVKCRQDWEPIKCEYPLSNDLKFCLINYINRIYEKLKFFTEYKYPEIYDLIKNNISSINVYFHFEKSLILADFKINHNSSEILFSLAIRIEREFNHVINEDMISIYIIGINGFSQEKHFNLRKEQDIKFEIKKILERFDFEGYYDEFLLKDRINEI